MSLQPISLKNCDVSKGEEVGVHLKKLIRDILTLTLRIVRSELSRLTMGIDAGQGGSAVHFSVWWGLFFDPPPGPMAGLPGCFPSRFRNGPR